MIRGTPGGEVLPRLRLERAGLVLAVAPTAWAIEPRAAGSRPAGMRCWPDVWVGPGF
jgi:hypothetical protein